MQRCRDSVPSKWVYNAVRESEEEPVLLEPLLYSTLKLINLTAVWHVNVLVCIIYNNNNNGVVSWAVQFLP